MTTHSRSRPVTIHRFQHPGRPERDPDPTPDRGGDDTPDTPPTEPPPVPVQEPPPEPDPAGPYIVSGR